MTTTTLTQSPIALKTIIKRNKTHQPFSINKAKGWARWGCQDLKTVNWGHILRTTIASIKKEAITSEDFQMALISTCMSGGTYEEAIMAGRLYVPLQRKRLFPEGKIPTFRKVYESCLAIGLVNDYNSKNLTDEQWDYIESVIDHQRDFDMTYGEVVQLQHKYAIKSRVTKQTYETPQHVYMRMALFVVKKRSGDDWKASLKELYDLLSNKIISYPSPNYINMGTPHNGLASCCLFVAGDSIPSLEAAQSIGMRMSAASAGIGGIYNTRSIDDPVRNGAIIHGGKLPYFSTMGKTVLENVTAGRNGAVTLYYSGYDPEVTALTMMQNPMTPISKQNRDIHTAMLLNNFMVSKAIKGQDVLLFNCYTHPELYKALFNGDESVFEVEYEKAIANTTSKDRYLSAREILVSHFTQWVEVSTNYKAFISEINRHTPHLDTIYSGNLCVEVTNPTKAYKSIEDLFRVDHHDGEVSICTLAGVVVYNVPDDATYEKAAYWALETIDVCIDESEYAFPHIAYTAKMRRNAGVGMMGNAFVLAKEGLSVMTQEGRNKEHQMAERHAYWVLRAALKLGKEKGNAPWIHKTKWPQGWTWLSTYNTNVDELVTCGLQYDWDEISAEIVENKGIRFSSLINLMPGESSSKATGSPNSIYLIRSLTKSKTDESNVVEWVAPQPKDDYAVYELAYNVPIEHHIYRYAIYQKWTDQSISADYYMDRSTNFEVSEKWVLNTYALMAKYGTKSCYYMNTESVNDESIGCGSGGCTL